MGNFWAVINCHLKYDTNQSDQSLCTYSAPLTYSILSIIAQSAGWGELSLHNWQSTVTLCFSSMYKYQSLSGKANNRLRFKTQKHSLHNISSYVSSWMQTNYEKACSPQQGLSEWLLPLLTPMRSSSIQQVDPCLGPYAHLQV